MLAEERADPAKGSGAVMCCTFGDATDVEWWREYDLPLKVIIGRDGRLTADGGSICRHDHQRGARRDREVTSEQAGNAARSADNRAVGACARALRYARRVHRDDAVVRARARLQGAAAGGGRAHHLASGAHGGTLPRTGWRTCAGTGASRASATSACLSRCGTATHAARRCWPNEDELPMDPTERQPTTPCDVWRDELHAGDAT